MVNVVEAWMGLTGLLLPDHCPGCAAMLPPGQTVCMPCGEAALPLQGVEHCPQCMDLASDELCWRCRETPPPFASVQAGLVFGESVRDAVHRLKFGDAPWAARALWQWAWPQVPPGVKDADLLVPLPLHPSRHRSRGYDQAALLARALHRQSGVALAHRALRRTRPTAPVADMDPQQRADAVRDAFAVPRPSAVKGRVVVVVDDVVTTGATVRAAAGALRNAGAAQVRVVCAARGGDMDAR